MKTVIKPKAKLKVVRISRKNSHFFKKGNYLITQNNFKFYQKLFLVIISLFTILILPQSPKDLESACENYYPSRICNVW